MADLEMGTVKECTHSRSSRKPADHSFIYSGSKAQLDTFCFKCAMTVDFTLCGEAMHLNRVHSKFPSVPTC